MFGFRKDRLVQFWEAKCRENYIITDYLDRIYNELERNHCNLVCFINTKIIQYNPLEVSLFVDKFTLDKPIENIKIGQIVLGLEKEIIATAVKENCDAEKALNELLSPTILSDRLELNNDTLKNILGKFDKKINNVRENPNKTQTEIGVEPTGTEERLILKTLKEKIDLPIKIKKVF